MMINVRLIFVSSEREKAARCHTCLLVERSKVVLSNLSISTSLLLLMTREHRDCKQVIA